MPSLHNEIHARPPESIAAPTALTHLVMVCDSAQREASRQHLAALLRDHHRSVPDEHTTHVRVDVGGFRLRWELHTEFVSWTFQSPLASDVLLDTRSPPTAAEEVPQAWLAALPGHSLACIHLWIVQTAQCGPGGLAQVVEHMLNTDTLAGSPGTPGANPGVYRLCHPCRWLLAHAGAAGAGDLRPRAWGGWCSACWRWKPTA